MPLKNKFFSNWSFASQTVQKMDLSGNNGEMPTEELLRRVLQNQRTLLEQNAKLLKNQEQQANLDKEQGKTNCLKAPAFVKVSTDIAQS